MNLELEDANACVCDKNILWWNYRTQ